MIGIQSKNTNQTISAANLDQTVESTKTDQTNVQYTQVVQTTIKSNKIDQSKIPTQHPFHAISFGHKKQLQATQNTIRQLPNQWKFVQNKNIAKFLYNSFFKHYFDFMTFNLEIKEQASHLYWLKTVNFQTTSHKTTNDLVQLFNNNKNGKSQRLSKERRIAMQKILAFRKKQMVLCGHVDIKNKASYLYSCMVYELRLNVPQLSGQYTDYTS